MSNKDQANKENTMKFLLSENNTDIVRVRLDGDEEEQQYIANLAENLFNNRNYDTFAGKVVSFNSVKQFKKFLGWRAIFNQCSPNKTFNFMPLARNAVKEVRAILENDVRRVDCNFSIDTAIF
jgi:hypothetical protein